MNPSASPGVIDSSSRLDPKCIEKGGCLVDLLRVLGASQEHVAVRSAAAIALGERAKAMNTRERELTANALRDAIRPEPNWTARGQYLLALGRNEEAARYSGINTKRMVVLAYVLCALAAGLGGILFALDVNSVQPSGFGNFYELYAIAAAVLGGCSLRGGEGTGR